MGDPYVLAQDGREYRWLDSSLAVLVRQKVRTRLFRDRERITVVPGALERHPLPLLLTLARAVLFSIGQGMDTSE